MQLDDHRNWVVPARWQLSPNHDARPEGTTVSLIVVHGISLPGGHFGTGYPADLFLNQLDLAAHPSFEDLASLHVSAHALIDRAGEITQFVPFSLRAWHAGVSQFRGQRGCNDFSVGVELEGTDDIPYEAAQYETLARLIQVLRVAYPAIADDSVVGHCDIAPGRKTDPGPAFRWDRLRALMV